MTMSNIITSIVNGYTDKSGKSVVGIRIANPAATYDKYPVLLPAGRCRTLAVVIRAYGNEGFETLVDGFCEGTIFEGSDYLAYSESAKGAKLMSFIDPATGDKVVLGQGGWGKVKSVLCTYGADALLHTLEMVADPDKAATIELAPAKPKAADKPKAKAAKLPPSVPARKGGLMKPGKPNVQAAYDTWELADLAARMSQLQAELAEVKAAMMSHMVTV